MEQNNQNTKENEFIISRLQLADIDNPDLKEKILKEIGVPSEAIHQQTGLSLEEIEKP